MPVQDNLRNAKIGTTDISDIGDGTCTGGVRSIQDQINSFLDYYVKDEMLYAPQYNDFVSK